jgi:transcriptional regulator with XRE-family HTH domain
VENDLKQLQTQRIKDARKSVFPSTYAAAKSPELAGIGRSALANYESGLRTVNLNDVEQIAKAYKVSAAWLLGLSDIQTAVVPAGPYMARASHLESVKASEQASAIETVFYLFDTAAAAQSMVIQCERGGKVVNAEEAGNHAVLGAYCGSYSVIKN